MCVILRTMRSPMFAPGIARPVSARVGRQWPAVRIYFLKKGAARNSRLGDTDAFNPQRERASALRRAVALCEGGFTLIELLVVVGIIALLLVLIAPAFTYIKGGTDVTSAAYTIQGVLGTARTYAKANNTYTWVGFFEEDEPPQPPTSPATPGTGRVVMSIVASKDGTMLYSVPLTVSVTLQPANLIQVGKLTKIDNV